MLPDPDPRAITVPIISVDDHLIEPPDLFIDRLPAALQEGAPRIVEDDAGNQSWLFESRHYPNIGLNAVVGRPREQWSMEPARFDQMRPGCFDIDERIADMDRAGIWASLCFPSLVSGFCGAVYSRAEDKELGLACLRAFNDWHHEVWAAPYPARIIPLQLPWLADVEIAVGEIERNAARGFRAMSFPEFPAQLGFPSIFSGHWDPLFAACEETGTVVCLHTGSSSWAPLASPASALRAPPHAVSRQRAGGRRRVALVGRAPALPPTLRRHVRGRDRVGADAHGPGRLRAPPLGLGQREHGVAVTVAAERGPLEELLVLLHRRPLHGAHAPCDRHRSHHGGERLSPRRLFVARHPGRAPHDVG